MTNRPACPICKCDRLRIATNSNNTPEHDAHGILTGVRAGVPSAVMTCENGCTIAVTGERIAALNDLVIPAGYVHIDPRAGESEAA